MRKIAVVFAMLLALFGWDIGGREVLAMFVIIGGMALVVLWPAFRLYDKHAADVARRKQWVETHEAELDEIRASHGGGEMGYLKVQERINDATGGTSCSL